MICVVCGEPALQGLDTDLGPMCKVHAFAHVGVPLGEEQEEAACRNCRRLIRKHEACYIEDSGFWHEECLTRFLRKDGKCPKHGTDTKTCGCWGDPIAKLVEQAKQDASVIWKSGGKHELCYMCLRFNRATTMGLPLYSQTPQPAEEVCGACFKPICHIHLANPPEKNILGLSTKEIYCDSSWTGGCYEDLKKKIACAFEGCETTSPHFREPESNIWDPLVDSGKCDECDAFYCQYVSGHEQCPECEGYPCEHCSKIFPKEELTPYEENSYSIIDLCEDCLQEQHDEDEERAFSDYFVDDFKKALARRFAEVGLDLDIDYVDNEILEKLIREAMDECSISVEHHGEGPHLDLIHVAECIDPTKISSLQDATINGYNMGPHVALTRKIVNGLRRLKTEYDKGESAAYRRAARMRAKQYSEKKKPTKMSRKRRAELREQMRRSMMRSWYRKGDPKRRALERAPKTIKGMKPFLGLMSPEYRAKYSQALRKERKMKRKRPNPYRQNIDFVRKPRPSFIGATLEQERKFYLADQLRRHLLQKLTVMPSRLLKMNRAIARQLFKRQWNVEVGFCEDHGHVEVVLPLNESIDFADIDNYAEGVFDDVIRTIMAIVGEVVGNNNVKLVEDGIEDEESGKLKLVIDLRIETVPG